jgi:protein-tyrosine phosphatase
MGIFSLFQKKDKLPTFDFSSVKVDMHSHLLPGIDDGSKTLGDTIGMILKMVDLGYEKLIMTPHVMEGYYPNTSEIILNKLKEVKEECVRLSIPIELHAAAEYYYDDTLMARLDRDEELLTFSGKHVLFEFPFNNPALMIDAFIKKLKEKGYIPVLAHFERYVYYHGMVGIFDYYKGQNVRLQLNLLSLTGHYGPDVLKQAKYMVDHGLVDFVGTDCHRIEHLHILEKNKSNPYFKKLLELDLINSRL